ncbi:glycosyltransferase family 4 protein [Rhodococcus sp. IEGM 1401]|uniref:glycosyltransferase family 4 protein n=1 Tax=unclassified Rhodococcus (in: high G+C Gram-positive bacteria) TaxID=192944 RepID=UPI0022B510D2|nr:MULTISPECIES: glycosyltransferase family 4 protein [unclassified Rhodococcus (in: high G+C Gram-positive bacteria)]MCZ4560878.1 glycosyltransferase family 4 protein [Rhodococcus sp. IEGM 1401]MDI9921019.1 glycosyltransferase family 4 protein [Rhodococcus sp. IEGM 1372]MDV8033381.1 glycosyltransferase family 4 protein [Rhodococcus sp. IEGM 1414]
MTGSEWFGSLAGGLNRYFESLYHALSALDPNTECCVTAAAFGDALPGAQSWGALGRPLPLRLAASSTPIDVRPGGIVDRHFALYGYLAPVRGKAVSVTHFHGPWAAESAASGSRAGAKFAVEKFLYHRSDAYIVLSQSFKTLLVEDYSVAPEDVRVIPPGAELDRFHSTAIPDEPPLVVSARRLEKRMGLDVLIAGWPAVIAAHPDARLSIVGTGSYEGELRRMAAESSAGASITFEGRVSDERLAQLYALATVTVVPSLSLEGFGLIALESLASGRAPIVTNCGGLPDSVTGLDPSLVVPTGDTAMLAERISDALSGSHPTPEQCRAHAETFDWRTIAHRHVDLYSSLLERHS